MEKTLKLHHFFIDFLKIAQSFAEVIWCRDIEISMFNKLVSSVYNRCNRNIDNATFVVTLSWLRQTESLADN